MGDRVNAWREVDSERWQWGVVLGRYGLTVYVLRRCYRVSWWRP